MHMSGNTPNQTILVVDDIATNIDLLSSILRPDYKVKAAVNGKKALKIASENPKPDMILLDIMMPDMDGFEVCALLKDNPATAMIPIIFVTARGDSVDEQKGFELGAVDYITKPVKPPVVKARVRAQLALYDQNQELERKVKQRTEQLLQTQLAIVRRLGRAAEFKDNETGMHVIRMSYYARFIAAALNISDEWTDLVANAAPMHDIGKIGIPDRILMKEGKLDADEWRIMKKHSEYGAEIIGNDPLELMRLAKEIALTHHEKWDGSGYPNGLEGTEIPLSGRIVAIADVFDALTSIRPYKPAWPVEQAIKYIDENSDSHFDPALVATFHECLPQILEIKEQYSEISVEEIVVEEISDFK